jgi:hypothetical protein
MKKFLFTMTAMLSVSAAFVSCSDKEVFNQAAVEQAQVEKTEVQYKEAFVKHFGEVNPNQSWDFSQINYPQADQTAQTRAWIDDLFGTQLPAPTWSEPTLFESFLNALFYETHYQHAATDFEEVKQLVDNQPVVDWPYDYAQINLHPFYSHGSSVINYYFLGVQYNQKDYGAISPAFNGFWFLSSGDRWSSIINGSKLSTEMNMNSYAFVNTTNMEGIDGFKWFVASRNTKFFDAVNNAQPLEKCKLFTVNNHTYVALDCNGDGNYYDLICWVEDLSPAKRYMVEDLGSIGDFDFNDIVFDVVYNKSTSKYECIVRAMGGTLDFSIKVGNTEWWSKSGAKYDIKTMYNTMDPNYDLTKEYARFNVSGWVPENNDVTVTVEGNNGRFVLPFPKNGEIPYIVATNVGKAWSKERVNVNTLGWFGSVQNDCAIEVKE